MPALSKPPESYLASSAWNHRHIDITNLFRIQEFFCLIHIHPLANDYFKTDHDDVVFDYFARIGMLKHSADLISR